MALNIYKPGQGYWTRMLSAIGGGILVVGGALWLKSVLEAKLSDYHSHYVVLIEWGVAAAIVAIFAPLIYRWVGTKPRTCDFMIATEGEMKKVAWPDRKEVIGSTLVVIWCMVLMAILLFVSDYIFAQFFSWIHVLELHAH